MSSTSEPPPMYIVFTEDFSYTQPPTYGVRFTGNCGLSPYYSTINDKANSLRDVNVGDYVMDEDINDFIELLRNFDELNKAIVTCVESQGMEVPTSLKQQIDYFSVQVSLLEMVKSGMLIKHQIWNDIVNLMKYEETILDTLKNQLYPTLLVPKPVFQDQFTYVNTPPTVALQFIDQFTYVNTPPTVALQFIDDFTYQNYPPDLYLQFIDDFTW